MESNNNKIIDKSNKSNKIARKSEIDKILNEYNSVESIEGIIKIFKNKMDDDIKLKIVTGTNQDIIFNLLTDHYAIQNFKIIYPMREELIKEFEIKTRSERMLLDSAIICYVRFLVYQKNISSILKSDFFPDRGLNIDRYQRISESAIIQFNRTLESIRRMKIMHVNFNFSNSQVNLGKNQQINNSIPNPNNFGSEEEKNENNRKSLMM